MLEHREVDRVISGNVGELSPLAVLVIFDGSYRDFHNFRIDYKIMEPLSPYYTEIIGISEEYEIHKISGRRFLKVYKTDKGDFWLWAKCVEMFQWPLPPEEVELGEIVPCQFPEFDMKNV